MRVQGRNQRDQAYKPVFAHKLALRQVSPPSVALSLVTMRPKTLHDPAIRLVEEPADMGLEVRLAAVTLLERRARPDARRR